MPPKNGHHVQIYEKNDRLGRKLFITGKGRCNITNASDVEELFQTVVSNPKFLYSAFYSFTNEQVIDFFENLGVKTKVERGNRVFPVSDHSSDIIGALQRELHRLGVQISLCTEVEKICVDNLDIAYGYDVPILKNISFTIEPGEKVFLMGSSGCGKSTLAKTIAGLVKYNKGEIIWGNDRNLNISDLSKQVLYLSQESEIFSGSIQENILMWEKDCNQLLFDEVIEAMGISQMMSSRSLSLDSYLSENGTNLSGGEKQRVALARAMMRNVPTIYI